MTNKAWLKLAIQKLYAWPILGLLYALIHGTSRYTWPLIFITPAMVLVPIALLLYRVEDGLKMLPKWLAWMETPDEYLPGDLDGEPTVKKIYDKTGWFTCSWYWLALRNIGHGIMWSEGKIATDYFNNLTDKEKQQQGLTREYIPLLIPKITRFKRTTKITNTALKIIGIGKLQIQHGWWVYPDPYQVKTKTGFWAVPHLTVRKTKPKQNAVS